MVEVIFYFVKVLLLLVVLGVVGVIVYSIFTWIRNGVKAGKKAIYKKKGNKNG